MAVHLLRVQSQVMGAQFYDALVTIPGCDKNMPGMADVVTHFSIFHLYRFTLSFTALKIIIVGSLCLLVVSLKPMATDPTFLTHQGA